MFRSRPTHAMIEAEPAGPAGGVEDQDHDAGEPDDADELDGDLTALAERHRDQATRISAQAAQHRAQARTVADDAEQRASAITTAARATGLALTADAAKLEQRATSLAARATALTHAADLQRRANDADELVTGLDAERAELAAQIAAVDANLARLDAERTDLGNQRNQARADGDLDALQAVLVRDEAVTFLTADYGVQHRAAMERLQAIGDGEHGGELARARETAAEAHSAATRARHSLFPDTAEAQRARDLAELRNALQGTRERLATEADQGRPRPIVVQ